MVSTITILLVSVLSLYLVWTVLRPGLPSIKNLEDWEASNHAVDPELFGVLLDPAEAQYLRHSLPPHEFQRFQRKRIGLALRWLDLVGENAAMLMRLGQLARASPNSTLAREAEDLIHSALRLRVNLALAQPCLWVKWLFPGWTSSLPAIEIPYANLLIHLSRIRQQRQVKLDQALMVG